jgi:lysophospholipase L1-like esterase
VDDIKGDHNKSDGEGLGTLLTYVNIIKEVAEFYSLPTLDLWSVSGIQPNVKVLREKYCPDGLHPNDAGHKIIASRLAGFLKSL